MKLSGKTAIVTGAGSGMGKAIAVLFGQEGANVVVADINQTSINSVVDEINAKGGQATGVVSNVAQQEDVDNMIRTAVDTFHSLDVLVNNAGVMDNFTPVGDVTDKLWERVLAVNLTGPFKAARAAINVMKNQESGGVIINNASVGGLYGARGGAAYIAAKHGLIGLTKNIAATYGSFGNIRANAIAPGGVNTNIQSTITEPHELGLKALTAAGSGPSADPVQIARVAVFLASNDSDFVNGDVIKADGGWTAR
ncbi:SDR family oxidoreductase [Oceanobacillus neutriphilus]|uniref:3-ketoacyl-ACP reductase n=1 Tax=Oceanobacillus neutriphilus TaxID=531815 RepID=A0ABQ2NTM7_9BACI|nr:SDR family oxidoreductase [Oceanobacillus neutriphilus]GGP08893.1 3-ketoacyl-ACP reductase [Oceanobacillus neutriphilus]